MKFKKFAAESEENEDEECGMKLKPEPEQEEEWETVTIEREQWARLCDLLELLTNLSLLTGVTALQEMPSIILITHELDDDDDEINLKGLKFKMLSNGRYSYSIKLCIQVIREISIFKRF